MQANVEKFQQLANEWSQFQGFIEKIQEQSNSFHLRLSKNYKQNMSKSNKQSRQK